MDFCFYAKFGDDLNAFKEFLHFLKKDMGEINFVFEVKSSFLKYYKLIQEKQDLVIVMPSLESLGDGSEEIVSNIRNTIKSNNVLVFLDIPSTYQFGIDLDQNKAILNTIIDVNKYFINKSNNLGRPRTDFPKNWEELYGKWIENQITATTFYKTTGLKKATFYNMVTEYKRLLEEKNALIKTKK